MKIILIFQYIWILKSSKHTLHIFHCTMSMDSTYAVRYAPALYDATKNEGFRGKAIHRFLSFCIW